MENVQYISSKTKIRILRLWFCSLSQNLYLQKAIYSSAANSKTNLKILGTSHAFHKKETVLGTRENTEAPTAICFQSKYRYCDRRHCRDARASVTNICTPLNCQQRKTGHHAPVLRAGEKHKDKRIWNVFTVKSACMDSRVVEATANQLNANCRGLEPPRRTSIRVNHKCWH